MIQLGSIYEAAQRSKDDLTVAEEYLKTVEDGETTTPVVSRTQCAGPINYGD